MKPSTITHHHKILDLIEAPIQNEIKGFLIHKKKATKELLAINQKQGLKINEQRGERRHLGDHGSSTKERNSKPLAPFWSLKDISIQIAPQNKIN